MTREQQIRQYEDKLARIKGNSPAANGLRAAIKDDIDALKKSAQ